jgi:hypothetical protein
MTWKHIKKKYRVNRWRVVEGFENYRVTDDGRLWSYRLQAFVKFHKNKNHYVRVELWKNQYRERPFIHRLVGKYFCKNTQPRKRLEINHLDFNIENNHYTNLQWCTRLENVRHNRNKWKYNSKPTDWKEFNKEIKRMIERAKKNPTPEPQPVKYFFPVIDQGPVYSGDEPPF